MTDLNQRDFERLTEAVMSDPAIRRAFQTVERADPCNDTANNRAVNALDTAMDTAVRRAAQKLDITLTPRENERFGDQLISMALEGRGGVCQAPSGGRGR